MYEGITLNAIRCSFKGFCCTHDLMSAPSAPANSNNAAPNASTQPSLEGSIKTLERNIVTPERNIVTQKETKVDNQKVQQWKKKYTKSLHLRQL